MTKYSEESIKRSEKKIFSQLENHMMKRSVLYFLQDFGEYLVNEYKKMRSKAERVGFNEYMTKNQFPDCEPDVTENDKKCAKYLDTLCELDIVMKDVGDCIKTLIDRYGSDYE